MKQTATSSAPSAASSQDSINPPPAPDQALATQEEEGVRTFDPGDYKWVPVLRKPRKDGWTPQRQVDFIGALADTGCVETAAREAGMSSQSCYRLRRSRGAEDFARAWETATAHAAKRLVDVAFERAINGSDEPVFDRDGNCTGRRMRQNDRLLMILLRAYMPERFRHAHRDTRLAAEALPLPAEPLAPALSRLAPPEPPEPYTLMEPDELADALMCADILDGELPHWYKGKGDAEPSTSDERSPDPSISPLGEKFERQLAAAKREAAGLPPEPEPWPDPWDEEEGESPFLD